MTTRTLEITGKFLRERHRFANADGDVIVGEIDCDQQHADINPPEVSGKIPVKGPLGNAELTSGMQYRFYGRWTSYRNKYSGQTERQFSFSSFVVVEPAGRDAILAYLKLNGRGHRLGLARAQKLWEVFGERAVVVARTEPETVARVLSANGLSYPLASAKDLSMELQKNGKIERTKLDLTGLLAKRGFPRKTLELCIETWGNRAADLVRRDPFKLLRFPGCGFKRCDSMYLDMGLDPARLKRQAICVWYSLEQNPEGHTWHSWRVPDAFLRSTISGTQLRIGRAIELAERAGLIRRLHTDGDRGPIIRPPEFTPDLSTRWYADAKKADSEQTIVSSVLQAQAERHIWSALGPLKNVSDHQQEMAAKALVSSLCILGGSPGTGKTWLVSELVAAVSRTVGLHNILVGAPTGKAAVRVTENLQAKNINLRARTWHSLLYGLERDKLRHFSAKILIGDESSMLDADLMAWILRSRAAGTMVMLVGDVNQLPPVGHGAPLRDMIAAGVPYAELTEIVRNTGGIVEACAAIREQRAWSHGDNLHIVDANPRHKEHLNCIQQIAKQATAAGIDPVWGMQIVVAVNERSPLSRAALNQELQAMFNKQPGRDGIPFRVDDKVVNTKNGFFKSLEIREDEKEIVTNELDEVYVANGELGRVVAVEPNNIICDLDSPRRRIQAFFSKDFTFELGYALSVHKSQGSDWPWVVVALDDYPGARMVCDRSWLYTAISRAKAKCWLLGRREIADRMCRQSKIWHRKTFVREQILQEQSFRSLVEV